MRSQTKRRKPALPLNPFAEWAVNLLILLFATAMIAQPYVIPTGSMEENLLIGDHVIVDKLAYAPAGGLSRHLLPYQDVRRGDIVVFRYPLDISENYVKRVIGVPGDQIRIQAKQLILNGEAVAEPYKVHKTEYLAPYRDYFPAIPPGAIPPRGLEMLRENVRGGELVVPAGHYFMLGDNRDLSEDSRYWGFVPHDNIIGKPVLTWWSYDAPTERLASGNIDPEHVLDIALHFFSKTRWERTFRLIRGYPLKNTAAPAL